MSKSSIENRLGTIVADERVSAGQTRPAAATGGDTAAAIQDQDAVRLATALDALATVQAALEVLVAQATESAGSESSSDGNGGSDGEGEGENGQPAGSDLQDLAVIGQGASGTLGSHNRTPPPIGHSGEETSRFGRDGLKHGEMGSAGHNVETPLGAGLGHLTGLGDEGMGRRNGEQHSTSENFQFPGEIFGIGTGLDHLWLLGDTEYYRSSNDDDIDAPPPLLSGASFSGIRLVALPPHLSGKGETPEDIPTTLKLEIVLAHPGGESVREIRIAAPPAGTVIDWDHALPGLVTVLPNGDIVITGGPGEIEKLANSVSVLPPDDFSGMLTLGITVTVAGFGTTATAHLDYAITVIPVADVPDVTGDDQTTLEDQPVALPNLAGNLNDIDNSEVLSFEIRGVPAGASFQSGHVSPLDPTVWIFTPAEIAAGVTFVPTTNSIATVNMTIRAIATEQANGDTAYAEAPVVVHITPLNGPFITTSAVDTNEDTQVALGSHITLGDHDPDGSERIDGLTVAGLPAGTAFVIAAATGVQVVMNNPVSPTGFTISADPLYAGPPLTPAQIEKAIKDTLATLKVTPPLNSDTDLSVSITVSAHDATTGEDHSAHATLSVPVHAVADQPSGNGSGSGNEDTWIAVPITVAPTDTDGSETLEYVEITGVPATASVRWQNGDGSTNTSGTVTVDPLTGVIRITGTTAEIEARVQALQILTASNTDDDFTLSVKVGSIESNPTETGDIALLRNDFTFAVPVAVLPIADAATVSGSSVVVEDHTVVFGADVVLSKSDLNSSGVSGPSSETITRVVVNDIPSDVAAVGYHESAGVRVVLDDSLHPTRIVVEADPAYVGPPLTPAQLEQAIRDTVATLSLTPPHDSDRDITLHIDVTTVDRLGQADQSAPLTTSGQPFVIAVKADADPATLVLDPARNAGNEDQPIQVGFTVGRNDTDPSQGTASEAIQTVVIRDIPAGFTLSTAPATPGNASLLVANPDGTYTVTGPSLSNPVANDAAINDVLSHLVLTPVAAGVRTNLDDDFTLHVDVTTRENNLAGGQVETLTNLQIFAVPVTVAPIADPVTLPASSTVVEDNVAGFGAAIEAGLVKADQNSTMTAGPSSETITQVVISGIPVSGAQAIAAASWPGSTASVSTSFNIATGELTLTLQPGGSEQDLREALKLVQLTPHLNSDVDIPLSVAVTTVDRWGTAEASAPLVTTLAHTLIVTADATNDEPSVTGAASGVEDTLIALPVTVTMQDTDGSETLAKVEITGIPLGSTVSWSGLPGGATATPIVVGADTVGWTFQPANTTFVATQALRSFLASNLKITPPQDSGADFDLTVKAYNVESNLAGLGGSTGATPFGQGTIHVAVTPALDSVALPATSSAVDEDRWVKVNEDGSGATLDAPSVGFGSVIEAAIARGADKGAFDAADTTEGVGRVVLGNLPKDTVTYTAPAPTDPVQVSVAEHPVTHIQTFTIEANPAYAGAPLSSAALETAIRATLDTFRFTPAPDDSSDIGVSVAVYTQDTDPDASASSIGLSLTASATHTIVVNARADTPTVQGDSVTTNEDTSVALSLDAALRDHVGSSEVLSVVVSGVPQGATLSFGGTASIASSTHPVTGITSYTLTGSEAAIQSSLAAAQFNPQPQWSGTASMTISATATEVGADDVNAFAEPTADDTVTVSAPIVVTVTPVVDDVTFTNTSTIVQENAGNQTADAALTIDLGQRLGATMADLDGSQSLSLTLTGIRPDFSASFTTSILGVTTDVSTPGQVTISGASSADVLTVLATLRLTSTSDSDADFTVHVAGSTNEHALTPADAHAISFDHSVIVQSVADTPSLGVGAATKPVVAEDSGWVTYPVTVSLNDTDGSETYRSVVVDCTTAGPGTQPSFQFDPASAAAFSNVVFTAGAGSAIILTGPTAEIEAALSHLQVKPGTNNDADITVAVTATSVESNPSEANNNGPGVAGDEIAIPTAAITTSFVVPVAAVADTPSLAIDSIGAGGVGYGLEDTDIPLNLTASHGDTADGSEKIRDVVVAGVPAGFTLTSTGSGSVVFNAGAGTYTITGANDAAINDTLAKLKLVYAPGGARLNLDTDFQLQVTVTTIESAASEAGAGQGVNNTNAVTFPVDVPVHAVADGVTPSGSSTIVEDVANVIGTDIHWTLKDSDGTENVTHLEISGFPPGSVVSWIDSGVPITIPIGSTADSIGFNASHTTDGSNPIRTILDTLSVQAPTNSDSDFTLSVSLITTDNDGSTKSDNYNHTVTVQAVADTPAITASSATAAEDSGDIPLVVHPVRSSDRDGSETLSVLLSLPGGGSPLQTLTPRSVHDAGNDLTVSAPAVVGGHNVYTVTGTHGGVAISAVTITDNGNGTYLVEGAAVTDAASSTSGAAALDAVLGAGVLTLQTRAQWSGSLTGTNGIRVDAISTEAATAGQLADGPTYGGADVTAKTETVTAYIDVTVTPQLDVPVFSTATTIVQENNNTTNDSQQLTISLGTALGTTFADVDGSQSMTVTLAGIPTSAGDGATIRFGSTTVPTGVAGSTTISTPTGDVTVTTAVDGSITLDGANSIGVLSTLATLTVQIASDSDKNFTVDISGSTTETLGGTASFGGPGSPILHPVVIQAVADIPTVGVGTATKPTVLEDSDWVTYPVTATLNDGDGSETLQSVRIQYSTSGSGAAPQVQFDPAASALFSNVVFTPASGQVTLTGPTSEIQAALANLQVKPGANNGENITISVRATSVESSPSEANSTGPGVAGTEISIPTASRTSTFVIPVTPVPETPGLTVPAAASGTEDVATALAGISVSAVVTDGDGSETRYIEIKTTSYPAGSVFSDAGGSVGSIVTDAGTGETWLRIPSTSLATLKVLTPHDWSGVSVLEVRGVIVDHSTSRNIDRTEYTASQNITLTVAPDADAPLQGVASIGNEDTAISFGADLADLAHADHAQGIHVEDTTKGPATDGGIETISRIVLTVPADTPSLTYTIAHGAAVGTAAIVQAGNVYTITSSVITGAADPGALTDAQRATAEADIRATLATFSVQMGPTDTDQNGVIQVTATSLDVKNGVASTTAATFNHPVTVLAVADAPAIDAGFTVSGSENSVVAIVGGGGEKLVAHRSQDHDGSEVLSVEISNVPFGAGIGVTAGFSLPAGAAIADAGGGLFRITGASEADINSVLAHLAFTPVDFAGTTTLTVTAITTEQGQAGDPNTYSLGAGIAVKTATAVGTITFNILPEVDTPAVKGNAVGLEDQLIAVPIAVSLADKDPANGAETFMMKIANDLPAGTKLYGAGGTLLALDIDGTYHLTPADVDALKLLPPLDYSSPLQGDIVLHTTTVVTDTATTGAATASFANSITVHVTGVADAPSSHPVTVSALEDQPIALGAAILSAAGGVLNNLLVDTDGSERLSFTIGGLPAGILPSTTAGRLDYIGGGSWSISADDIATLTTAIQNLTLPAKPNFSGDDPYGALTVTAVSQEIDSSQATSAPWPVTIHVAPVLDPSLAIDGLSGWSPGVTQPEDAASAGASTGISLASVTSKTYVDNDGSEKVVGYDFDLTKMFTLGDAAHNAGIDSRCAALYGNAIAWNGLSDAAKAQWFIDTFAQGTFSSHATDAGIPLGHIVVSEAQLDGAGQAVSITLAAGLSPAASPFLDSNVDFTIPVTASIRDTAVISGASTSISGTQSTGFHVSLQGVADTPTVFAHNPDKDSNASNVDAYAPLELVPLDMGGHSADTDIALGRSQSETVYYVLSIDSAVGAGGSVTPPVFALVDGSGNALGLDNGDNTWLIRASDVSIDPSTGKLLGINLQSAWYGGETVTITASLTTVAVEDDTGSMATNSAGSSFSFIIDPPPGGSAGTPPDAPTIDMTKLLAGVEDTSGAAASAGFVTPGANTASVAVMFDLPAGATITGATLNPVTGRWVATMADVNSGLVKITPPHDFSGVLDIPVEAVATGTNLLRASTSAVMHVPVIPVADGPAFTAAPAAGLEDTAVALNLALAASPTGSPADTGEVDNDGSETLGAFAYLRANNGATFIGGASVVAAGDADATLAGQSLVGWTRVPVAQLSAVQLLPSAHWHGTVSVSVASLTTDQLTYTDPATGGTVHASDSKLASSSFSVNVAAVADAPQLTVPDVAHTPVVAEDGTLLLSGLSAALADTDAANGGELLSVKISGAPDGTVFSHGSNNGDGSWTIPADKLASLSLTPPLNFSGTMHLALEGYSIETSNGDISHSSASFDVTVTPVADTVEVLAKDVSLGASGLANLSLNVRMTDTSASTDPSGHALYTGETLPELVQITFSGVPAGAFLVPSSGGALASPSTGTWVFTGTEAQANALQIAAGVGAAAGTSTISVSAVSLDGADQLATPVADTFRLTMVAPTNAGLAYTGTGVADTQDWSGHLGNDLMQGLAGNDILISGSGINVVEGGTGSDTMTGGSGVNTYRWLAGDDAGGAVDSITNFHFGTGKDHLDLSRLLSGFSQQTSSLDAFVQVKGDGRTIQVDSTGSGASFHDVVSLQGASLTQSDLHAMVKNGNLIV